VPRSEGNSVCFDPGVAHNLAREPELLPSRIEIPANAAIDGNIAPGQARIVTDLHVICQMQTAPNGAEGTDRRNDVILDVARQVHPATGHYQIVSGDTLEGKRHSRRDDVRRGYCLEYDVPAQCENVICNVGMGHFHSFTSHELLLLVVA